MTDLELRIKCAELDGWQRLLDSGDKQRWRKNGVTAQVLCTPKEMETGIKFLPDYVRDSEAAERLIASLSAVEANQLHQRLQEAVAPGAPNPPTYTWQIPMREKLQWLVVTVKRPRHMAWRELAATILRMDDVPQDGHVRVCVRDANGSRADSTEVELIVDGGLTCILVKIP